MAKRAVASTSVPYFARFVPRRDAALPFLPLVESGRGMERFMAVLLVFGGIFGGLAVVGLFLVASVVLSFGSTPGGAELAIMIACGVAVALTGIVLGVVTWRHATRPSGIAVGDDHLEISYKTFKRKLVVPKGAVRVVDIDDGSSHPMDRHARFPVAGPLPEGAYADALDNYPAGPWDDLDPQRRRLPVPWELPRTSKRDRAKPNGYASEDPTVPGWASKGPALVPSLPGRETYLWSGQGSSLPFLRCGPGDIPNVAVVFSQPQRSPRPPWWYDLLPANARFARFRGGREVQGFVMRMSHPQTAAEAFASWDVVRRITAEDVLDGGLLIAKPLVGVRAIVYTLLVVGPMVVGLVQRLLR